MARIYDAVCPYCGEILPWCKYDPPIERCDFCGARLSRRGKWVEDVFPASDSERLREIYIEKKVQFFRMRGVLRFRAKDGRMCTVSIKERSPTTILFNLMLKAGGEKIELMYKDGYITDQIINLREGGSLTKMGLVSITYDGRTLPADHKAVDIILNAAAMNRSPGVELLMEGGEIW